MYPDASAISYDEQNGRVSVVYNDHSLYIWDVKDVKKVGKSYSFLYHSACIWGLEVSICFLFCFFGVGDEGFEIGYKSL